jgi:hypothetical protein
MLSDPQSVTINAVAIPLPRVATRDRSSTYQSADGNVSEVVSAPLGKRNRRSVRINHQKVATDPFVSGNSRTVSMSATLIVDFPADSSYTVAEAKQVVDGFIADLNASSGSKITKILNGEN